MSDTNPSIFQENRAQENDKIRAKIEKFDTLKVVFLSTAGLMTIIIMTIFFLYLETDSKLLIWLIFTFLGILVLALIFALIMFRKSEKLKESVPQEVLKIEDLKNGGVTQPSSLRNVNFSKFENHVLAGSEPILSFLNTRISYFEKLVDSKMLKSLKIGALDLPSGKFTEISEEQNFENFENEVQNIPKTSEKQFGMPLGDNTIILPDDCVSKNSPICEITNFEIR